MPFRPLTLLRRLWRAAPPMAVPDTVMLRNWDREAIRAEFKQRYLTEFARYVAEDMVVNHNAALSFLTLAAVMAGMSFGGPVALLLGGGIAWRHLAMKRDLGDALHSAGRRLKQDLADRADSSHAGIESWLDRHEADLPDYLDKLDRAEDEQRAVRRIIARLNKAGSSTGCTKEERALLARHNYHRLTPPITPILRLPPRTGLGNWHHAQLARSLWRDVTEAAGERGRPFKRLLGLARITPEGARRKPK